MSVLHWATVDDEHVANWNEYPSSTDVGGSRAAPSSGMSSNGRITPRAHRSVYVRLSALAAALLVLELIRGRSPLRAGAMVALFAAFAFCAETFWRPKGAAAAATPGLDRHEWRTIRRALRSGNAPHEPELRSATRAAAAEVIRAPWQRTRVAIEVAALVLFGVAAVAFAANGWVAWAVLAIPVILAIAGCIAVEVDRRARRPLTARLLEPPPE
jgi:hypothetical protein